MSKKDHILKAMDMKVDTISFLLKQIKKCLEKNEIPAAFYMALTLPDICGHLMFPDLKSRPRYIKWFDKYIGNYEQSPLCKEDKEWEELPYLSGETMYKIRNSILHSGNNDLAAQLDLNKFLFIWDGLCESSGIAYDIFGKKSKHWNINIKMLSEKIVWATEAFIKTGSYDKKDLPYLNIYGEDDIPDVFK